MNMGDAAMGNVGTVPGSRLGDMRNVRWRSVLQSHLLERRSLGACQIDGGFTSGFPYNGRQLVSFGDAMIRKRLWIACFWGMLSMLGYLYLYEVLWTVGHPYHRSVKWATVLQQWLWLASFPSAQILSNLLPQEELLGNSVYLPFAVAPQWFAYGFLFGLRRGKCKLT